MAGGTADMGACFGGPQPRNALGGGSGNGGPALGSGHCFGADREPAWTSHGSRRAEFGRADRRDGAFGHSQRRGRRRHRPGRPVPGSSALRERFAAFAAVCGSVCPFRKIRLLALGGACRLRRRCPLPLAFADPQRLDRPGSGGIGVRRPLAAPPCGASPPLARFPPSRHVFDARPCGCLAPVRPGGPAGGGVPSGGDIDRADRGSKLANPPKRLARHGQNGRGSSRNWRRPGPLPRQSVVLDPRRRITPSPHPPLAVQ